MKGGFRRLVHPPSWLGDVDLDATRAERERVREAVRDRQLIEWLLSVTAPGDGVLDITAGPGSVAADAAVRQEADPGKAAS